MQVQTFMSEDAKGTERINQNSIEQAIEGKTNKAMYRGKIKNNLISFSKKLHVRRIFQQDDDRKHAARITPKSLVSPDLDPIETLWRILKSRSQQRDPDHLGGIVADLPGEMSQTYTTMLQKANYFLLEMSPSCNWQQQLCKQVPRLLICGLKTFFPNQFSFFKYIGVKA